MAEIRVPRLEQSQTHTRIKNVPIAVTPEGFWCCPSPQVFQKSLRPQNHPQKPKSIPQTLNPPPLLHKKPGPTSTRSSLAPDEHRTASRPNAHVPNSNENENDNKAAAPPRAKPEPAPKKVVIEFGETGTSDLRLILLGKQGITVKMSVHRSVLAENSRFFAGKILDQQLVFPCIEIDDCEDAETYVETIGLMYCRDPKQRLIKQSVDRVLRILKIGEQLGFATCVRACLEYLEAVPWVGEEEEERVVSSVRRLEGGDGVGVGPILKRVSSDVLNPPKDTLANILELVLHSKEEKARREMKSIVLKLLRENNGHQTTSDLQNETLYASCRVSLDSLLCLLRQAVSEPDLVDKHSSNGAKSIAFEADNLLWLLDILANRRAADGFAVLWVDQEELAELHARLPVVVRHHVSTVTAKLFVTIGRGEVLPSKETRLLLLKRWLQPLMDDYGWLQHGCRSFDRSLVEEGIGRTVLTLPLEDQQSILMSWLGSFLKAGDNCPNLLKAFEVWWRRTFVRPYGESSSTSSSSLRQADDGTTVSGSQMTGQ